MSRPGVNKTKGKTIKPTPHAKIPTEEQRQHIRDPNEGRDKQFTQELITVGQRHMKDDKFEKSIMTTEHLNKLTRTPMSPRTGKVDSNTQ